MARHHERSLLVLGLGLALSACGGGGGDDPPPSTTSYNAAAAYRNLLTTNNAWAVAGIGSDSNSWSFQINATPVAPAVFPVTGATTSRMAMLMAASVNGTLLSSFSMTYHFNAADTSLVGLSSSDGTCAVTTALNALPTNASVGQSGPLASMNSLAGCSPGSAVLGTASYNWSIVADGPVVLFCLNSEGRAPGGALLGSESDCIETSPGGTLGTRARITLTLSSPAFSLVAKNY